MFLWKLTMEVIFKINLYLMLIMKNSFEIPRDMGRKILEEHGQIKKQKNQYTTISKVRYHMLRNCQQIGGTNEGTSETNLAKRISYKVRKMRDYGKALCQTQEIDHWISNHR